MNELVRRSQPYAGLVLGSAALLFGLWGLVSGETYAFMGKGKKGFWIRRAEKSGLYWWNQAIYLGAGVLLIGTGVYLLREPDPPQPPK